ncbi:MAG TPA: PRC-barrel domain-containing protein, partial [Trebonia sp.]
MTTPQQWDNLIGLTAVDADGAKVGQVGQVYLDEENGAPTWVTVSTGLFGTRESFAPLYGASPRDGQLVLAVSKQLVQDAPSVDNDGHLSEAEVTALYQHYDRYLGAGQAQGEGTSTGRHAGENLDVGDNLV